MWNDFIALFFPNYCMACSQPLVKGERVMCLKCEYEIPKTNSHIEEQSYIATKFYGKVRLTHALACYGFYKKGRLQKLLHRFKYGNIPEIGELIGQKYGRELYEGGVHEFYDVIMPVPLHKKKLRIRGYNQSTIFANGLSVTMRLPVVEKAMIRTTQTTTQTRKSRRERWKNVENKFEVTNPHKVKGKRILLVDDVMTTGATLEACVQALQENDCEHIGVAVIAVAR